MLLSTQTTQVVNKMLEMIAKEILQMATWLVLKQITANHKVKVNAKRIYA
jgi:hypothetical protein